MLSARWYHEGGLDSVFGATFGTGTSTAKTYLCVTDHLGSPVLLMNVRAKRLRYEVAVP